MDPDPDVGLVDLGAEREVTALVYLGSLSPDDVAVELLHGPVAPGDELTDTEVVRLQRAGDGPAGADADADAGGGTGSGTGSGGSPPVPPVPPVPASGPAPARTAWCAIAAGSAATRPVATATPSGSFPPTRTSWSRWRWAAWPGPDRAGGSVPAGRCRRVGASGAGPLAGGGAGLRRTRSRWWRVGVVGRPCPPEPDWPRIRRRMVIRLTSGHFFDV